MGALDSNGIWIYDENEDAAPFSTMLNRLGESVSDAVGPYVGSSGWQTLSVSSGWTVTEPFRVIKVGALVMLQGLLTSASSGVTQNIVTLPAGFAPTQPWRFAVHDNTSGSADRMTIQPTGVVQAPGSRTNKVYSISTIWPVI
jgi:hypothetical protein